MPVAVATPPVIVQDVGTNTAGFSPADDNGTEASTGIVIEGPTEAPGGLDVTADIAAWVAGGVGGTLADADADGGAVGGVDTDDGGDGVALRPPACLPTKNAPTQIPMTATNPSIERLLLLAGVIEATYAPDPSTSSLAWATTD